MSHARRSLSMNTAHMVTSLVAICLPEAKQSKCQSHYLPLAIWLGLVRRIPHSVLMVGGLQLISARSRNPGARKAMRVTKIDCSGTWRRISLDSLRKDSWCIRRLPLVAECWLKKYGQFSLRVHLRYTMVRDDPADVVSTAASTERRREMTVEYRCLENTIIERR
jgi:hypothetical protein